MTPQDYEYTYSEEARRALAQVYTLLLDTTSEDQEMKDAPDDDPKAPARKGTVRHA